MGPVIVILIIVFVGFIVYFAVKLRKTSSTLATYKQKIIDLNLGYKIEDVKGLYDLKIYNDNVTILAKIINIPYNAEVQINNKYTYEIKYGAGDTPGKVQPYSKYLTNIKEFINLETDKNEIKVFIASPSPKKIVKWINECEIVFVNCYTDVYGVRVIAQKDLTLFKNPYNEKTELD